MEDFQMKATLLTCFVLALAVALGAAGSGRLGHAEDPNTDKSGGQPEAPVAQAPAESRPEDRAAIREAVASFVKAFESGDATATTSHMTEGAELIPDAAPPMRGRETIRKAYAEFFGKKPKRKITLDVKSLRFTSRDTAIQEGQMSVELPGDAPDSQRYSLLLVREDGKWLLAVIKEWPDEDADLSRWPEVSGHPLLPYAGTGEGLS
jgi:uncharacterized protein (TIGR02246 family)